MQLIISIHLFNLLLTKFVISIYVVSVLLVEQKSKSPKTSSHTALNIFSIPLQGISSVPLVLNYLIIVGDGHLFSKLNFVLMCIRDHTSKATKMMEISKIVLF